VVAGVAACLPDLLDGAVAKASGTTSKRGAYFDSISDRVSDTFLFMGVAWYLTDRDGGQAGFIAMAALCTAFLVSYQRAKAESMGYDAKGGILERAERCALLGVGVAFAAQLLVPVMWVIFLL
jgi:CDP-diacylglycerol--glycerol-3-phosphate 3-phosphatidyltransferase